MRFFERFKRNKKSVAALEEAIQTDYEILAGMGIRPEEDMYTFDTECIVDGDEYEEIFEALSAMTKGEVLLQNISSTVDHDQCVASLYFEYNNMSYHWNPSYENDWFDCEMITKLNEVLKGQKSKKLFYNSSTDQNMNIIFVSEEMVSELNTLVSDPFEEI